METAKIVSTYTVSETREVSIDYNGYNFLVIYGRHINGWFIAIPNWEICTEASAPDNVTYNTEKLKKVLPVKKFSPKVAEQIANAIATHWDVQVNFYQTAT